mgnify:CR=1 FL=1
MEPIPIWGFIMGIIIVGWVANIRATSCGITYTELSRFRTYADRRNCEIYVANVNFLRDLVNFGNKSGRVFQE